MLILLALKTLKNVEIFENALKEEMIEDLKYVKSVEKEVDDMKMEIDHTNHPIHHRLWMHKAHDGKPQVAVFDSRECHNQKGLLVEGLNHNLFSVGQFCDADLEVAFRKSTCFVRDLQVNDLLTGHRGSGLYTITLQESSSPTPIYFMEKALPTQAWLWHRRLSHLNFNTINLLSKNDIVKGLPKLKYLKDQLCSSCEMGKEKRSTFKTKIVPSSKGRLHLLHMDLCGPIRDETPEVLNDFLKMIQQNLQAQVINVHTDKGLGACDGLDGTNADIKDWNSVKFLYIQDNDKLLDPTSVTHLFSFTKFLGLLATGTTADARKLVQQRGMRPASSVLNMDMRCLFLSVMIADKSQDYTQHAYMRPLGVGMFLTVLTVTAALLNTCFN
ncbi:retrovirus-related pol polyprotein from transposon TNT 1-94 [Tanacetum coccineum]